MKENISIQQVDCFRLFVCIVLNVLLYLILFVTVPPTIEDDENDKYYRVAEGQPIVLRCKATGGDSIRLSFLNSSRNLTP